MSTALIVEDEAVIALDLAEMIEGWGLEVIGPAGDAGLGVELAKQRRPDVAIVDIQLMKGRPTGIDVAAVLQGEMGIPVIYLSGLSDERLTYCARFTHPFAFIQKPIDEAYLKRVLKRALRGPGLMSAKA